jgi:hypothetical protein
MGLGLGRVSLDASLFDDDRARSSICVARIRLNFGLMLMSVLKPSLDDNLVPLTLLPIVMSGLIQAFECSGL